MLKLKNKDFFFKKEECDLHIYYKNGKTHGELYYHVPFLNLFEIALWGLEVGLDHSSSRGKFYLAKESKTSREIPTLVWLSEMAHPNQGMETLVILYPSKFQLTLLQKYDKITILVLG